MARPWFPTNAPYVAIAGSQCETCAFRPWFVLVAEEV